MGIPRLASMAVGGLALLSVAGCGDAMSVGLRDSSVPDGVVGQRDVGPTACPPSECDLIENGCPSGQACYWGADESAHCYDEGGLGEGEECRFVGDCKGGLGCLDPGDGPSRCAKYCCSRMHSQCDQGDFCIGLISDPTDSVTQEVSLCSRPADCSVISQTGCADGKACILSGTPPLRLCTETGAGGEGAGCSGPNDCQGGYTCRLPDRKCFKYCDAPEDCGGSQKRMSLGYTGDQELTALGFCTPLS